MIRAIAQILLNGVAILLAARIVPGIEYQGGLWYLLLTGLVIGLLNVFVRPLVTLLSLPMIVLTLGLFFIVINGLMVYLAAWVLDGLTVDGCWPAILGGLVLAVFNWVVQAFTEATAGYAKKRGLSYVRLGGEVAFEDALIGYLGRR